MKIFLTLKKTNLYLAFKKVNSIPTLPKKVDNYMNHIFVRIGRVIGGICFLLILSKNYTSLPPVFHKIVLTLGLLHAIHMIIIMSIKLVYSIYIFKYKPELFEVRN